MNTQEQLEDIERRIAQLDRQIEKLVEQADAWRVLARALREELNQGEPIDPEEIANFPTHLEALVHIARQNDGILRATDASQLFAKANRVSKASARPTIGRIVANRPYMFQKMGPGRWRLVEPIPPMNVKPIRRRGASSGAVAEGP